MSASKATDGSAGSRGSSPRLPSVLAVVEEMLRARQKGESLTRAETGDHWRFDPPAGCMLLTCEVLDSVASADGRTVVSTFSVAHWFEQNGDAMRDPEVVWNVTFADGVVASAAAIEYRQDSLGVFWTGSRHQAGTERFCRTWAKNLREQGFVDIAKRLGDALRELRERRQKELDAERAAGGQPS